MTKYFTEKELQIINKAWTEKKEILIDKYAGISIKNFLTFSASALKENPKWYESLDAFINAIIESSKIIGYLEPAV